MKIEVLSLEFPVAIQNPLVPLLPTTALTRSSSAALALLSPIATIMALLAIVLFLGLGMSGSLTPFWGASIFGNYMAARKMDVPIRIIPIDHTNPIWMLVDRIVLTVLKRLLPFTAKTSFTRYNFRGWELGDRYQSHHELGGAFVLVTPGRNWLYLADPDVLMEVFRRRVDFPRCTELTGTSLSRRARIIILSADTHPSLWRRSSMSSGQTYQQ